jgi:3-methyl-2-oxobutanoate hydroxymethyltransferase
MSADKKVKKVTIPSILQMKKNGERIAVLTAYDALMAELEDDAGMDIILVGDSAGMVLAGFETTIPVTMEMMLYHVSAAKRGIKRALLVADMPFLSYQGDENRAIENAGRFMKEAGAEAVKMEGGRQISGLTSKMTGYGIPVMGHLGLTPQAINSFGSYKLVGNDSQSAQRILDDARILEDSGVFSLVLEKIPASLAQKVTEALTIPTIGIGAGKYCDGQVLVAHDMLGMYDKFKPKFVRHYARLAETMRSAFSQYISDVKSAGFPHDNESY